MTGTSHQAVMCAELRIQVRISPTATATATVQSSPTMKWYQKRPKATIHDQIRPIPLCTGVESEHAPALDGDVSRRGQQVEREQAEDGAVAAGPLDAQPLERPERSEGREQDPDHELQEAARDARHGPVQNQADRADDDDCADPANHRHAELVGDRKSSRLNSSHEWSTYAVFCFKKEK